MNKSEISCVYIFELSFLGIATIVSTLLAVAERWGTRGGGLGCANSINGENSANIKKSPVFNTDLLIGIRYYPERTRCYVTLPLLFTSSQFRTIRKIGTSLKVARKSGTCSNSHVI